MLHRIFFLLLLVGFSANAFAQTASVYGFVTTNEGKPVEDAAVYMEGSQNGSKTDKKGAYRIQNLPAGKSITLVFFFPGMEMRQERVFLVNADVRRLDISLKSTSINLGPFTKSTTRGEGEAGNVQMLEPGKSYVLPGVQDGVTNMIKSLTGPGRSELTSQYTVRGGNYDENLVYVNDFEIYRPFLIRSGQQEGLTFVNADLVDNINFSIGGFQAKYGDKLSSVLDVAYRRPTKFRGTASASLLGGSLSLEGASKNDKFTYMLGLRQKSNQYLLQSQPTKGVYNPTFTDVQALVNYRVNAKVEVEAIGNYARNRFSFYPAEMVSSFGAVNEAYQLRVFYTGGEIDQFDSKFGGVSTTYRPNDRLRLKLLASAFQTDERETYDISGEYLLGELETDLGKETFGQIKTYLGTGIIQNHARNYLEVNTGTIAHRGFYTTNKHNLQWGLDANITNISDKLQEWERRDSAGFTQPYSPDLLVMTKVYRSSTVFDYNRYSGFIQDGMHFGSDSTGTLNIVGGVRFNYSDLNQELIISPRLQANYRPVSNHNIIYRFATGLYAQPPFYREMRDLNGVVNKDLKAQKSYHVVLGAERNFKLFNRTLKGTAEVYYKKLWDIVPYEYDDVRIRYYGQNAGEGYAYGGEVRLYGEFVRDATSWFSIGYLKTEEKLNILYKTDAGQDSVVSTGYIPRPTDQRLMTSLFLQDYLPRNKNFKVNLMLMYATGLPFGPPNGKRAQQTLRIPDYKRVDIGFSTLLLDGSRKERPAHSFFRKMESIWVSLEVFNLLGIQNTLSYSWIQDQTSGGQYAVPNRLTARLLNAKLVVKF